MSSHRREVMTSYGIHTLHGIMTVLSNRRCLVKCINQGESARARFLKMLHQSRLKLVDHGIMGRGPVRPGCPPGSSPRWTGNLPLFTLHVLRDLVCVRMTFQTTGPSPLALGASSRSSRLLDLTGTGRWHRSRVPKVLLEHS